MASKSGKNKKQTNASKNRNVIQSPVGAAKRPSKLSARNYGFQIPGIPVKGLTPSLNSNDMSLENLLNLQIVLGQAGINVDALVAYYYTLILMASWVQAIFVHKKLKRRVGLSLDNPP